MTDTRIEKDSLGTADIPIHVLWGIHTQRAQENFPISHMPISSIPAFIVSLAEIKQACTEANQALDILDNEVADPIVQACQKIIAGQHHEAFVVDMIQGGAGTSTNMNANEVIANLALSVRQIPYGRYDVINPIDHVNCSQSTNDVYPCAIKITLIKLAKPLFDTLDTLIGSFEKKAQEFAHQMTVARTQLQDAVPITFGQIFHAYGTMLRRSQQALVYAVQELHFLHLGGTAVGTGVTADPRFAELVISLLARITQLPLRKADDFVAATQDANAFVRYSHAIKEIAIALSKIASDLRILSSGPQFGFSDITLPARAAGSSVMPGKINPIIPEMVNQVAFEVFGHDTTVAHAADAGQLQLNAFEPIIAKSLFISTQNLTRACLIFSEKCVSGIGVSNKAQQRIPQAISLITILSPLIGYSCAAECAREALESERTIRDIIIEKNLLDPKTIDRLLSQANLTQPTRFTKDMKKLK